MFDIIVRLMPLNEPYRTKADLYGTARTNGEASGSRHLMTPTKGWGNYPPLNLPSPYSQPNGPPVRQLAKPNPENPHDPKRTHGLAKRSDRHR